MVKGINRRQKDRKMVKGINRRQKDGQRHQQKTERQKDGQRHQQKTERQKGVQRHQQKIEKQKENRRQSGRQTDQQRNKSLKREVDIKANINKGMQIYYYIQTSTLKTYNQDSRKMGIKRGITPNMPYLAASSMIIVYML